MKARDGLSRGGFLATKGWLFLGKVKLCGISVFVLNKSGFFVQNLSIGFPTKSMESMMYSRKKWGIILQILRMMCPFADRA